MARELVFDSSKIKISNPVDHPTPRKIKWSTVFQVQLACSSPNRLRGSLCCRIGVTLNWNQFDSKITPLWGSSRYWSESKSITDGQQEWLEMEGSCTTLSLSRLQTPDFLKPWGWTAPFCRCHRAPLPSLSTPTPIPREMTAEEKQTEEERAGCVAWTPTIRRWWTREVLRKNVWHGFILVLGTWAVFSNKMQLDYLKMDELRQVIRNSEDDSNDIQNYSFYHRL